MPEYITPLMMAAFEDELEKQALFGEVAAKVLPRIGGLLPRLFQRGAAQEAGQIGRQVGSRIAGAGAGLGLGAVSGGALGSGIGGYQGYQDAKARGESGVGGAISGAMSGGGKGLMVGAALGAGVGAAGGRVSSGLARLAAEGTGRGLSPSAIARFGQRQLHSVTGLTPGGVPRLLSDGAVNPAYMEAMGKMRMPSVIGAKARADAASAALAANPADAAAKKEFAHAMQGVLETQEAVGKGMTSLPGMAQGLLQKGGLKDVWRLGIKPQVTTQGRMGKAMVVLPAIGVGQEALTSGDVEGRGRGERIGRALGTGATYAAMPFMPIVGLEAANRGVTAVGGGIGRGIDKLVGAIRPPSEPELGQIPPSALPTSSAGEQRVEREFSDRALGRTPDMGIGGL